MISFVLFAASLSTVPIMRPNCDPPGQFRIVSANLSPGIEKGSFASKPKQLHRAGNGRARMQEQPDPANSIHTLIVMNAPDAWVVNLMDHTGKHLVDTAANKEVHIPALDLETPGMPPAWASIELGCERQFFAPEKAVQVPMVSGEHAMTKHQVTDGEWRVTLVTEKDSDVPWALMLSKSDKVIYTIRYLVYEHTDEVDATLYARPEGIDIQEP